MGVQTPLQDPAFSSFGCIHRSEIARSHGDPCLSFEACHTISMAANRWLRHFTPLPAVHFLTNTYSFLSFFIGQKIWGVKWCFTMVLIAIFLMSRDGEHHFRWIWEFLSNKIVKRFQQYKSKNIMEHLENLVYVSYLFKCFQFSTNMTLAFLPFPTWSGSGWRWNRHRLIHSWDVTFLHRLWPPEQLWGYTAFLCWWPDRRCRDRGLEKVEEKWERQKVMSTSTSGREATNPWTVHSCFASR